MLQIPGLVDLQVNGFKGVDFSSSDLTDEDFVRSCHGILSSGTSAFLPTIITSTDKIYQRNLGIISNVLKSSEFRDHVLGIHLEGPFISAQDGARGAHNRKLIREPDVNYLKQLMEWADGQIKMITIASEIHGAEKLSLWAKKRGITVSLGHQMATAADLDRLVRAGATALTHLGNGVPALLPRHDNPIWSSMGNDNLTAMIISDGHHLPPAVLKTILRTKGTARCVVVSDASPLTGLTPGSYNIMGNEAILEKSGRVYNPRTGYLVGSSATMLDCMNYLARINLLTVEQLILVGFTNPLELIGICPDSIKTKNTILYDDRKKCFLLEKCI